MLQSRCKAAWLAVCGGCYAPLSRMRKTPGARSSARSSKDSLFRCVPLPQMRLSSGPLPSVLSGTASLRFFPLHPLHAMRHRVREANRQTGPDRHGFQASSQLDSSTVARASQQMPGLPPAVPRLASAEPASTRTRPLTATASGKALYARAGGATGIRLGIATVGLAGHVATAHLVRICAIAAAHTRTRAAVLARTAGNVAAAKPA